jgi:hypothetical protein
MDKLRDKIAHAVSNWVLNNIATEEYRQRLDATYILGLEELERRKQQNKTRAMLGNRDFK